jgi:hypothetical protein
MTATLAKALSPSMRSGALKRTGAAIEAQIARTGR